jgi:hypothetical protein
MATRAVVEENDIYVIFDKKGENLKAVGLMNTDIEIKQNDFVKPAPPIKNADAKKSPLLNYSLNSLISISNRDALEENDYVLVKVELSGAVKYLPGKVSARVGADYVVDLYTYADSTLKNQSTELITIQEVHRDKIHKNIPVNDPPTYTGDSAKFNVLCIYRDNNTPIVIKYDVFVANSIVNVADQNQIDIKNAGGDLGHLTFVSKPILGSAGTGNKTEYLIQGTNYVRNLRILYYYTVVDNFTDPKDPNDSTKNITVVRGGKKSKDKTRKNTMPLQFAPGAKRSYLKRRKSSRK